jgi:hypothetical protein
MNSYTQHIRNRMGTAKQEVMRLLRWSELDYCQYQEKMGRQYLQSYIPHSPEYIDYMLASRIFWNWFKNQWLQRDEAFVKDNDVQQGDRAFRLQVYCLLHHPERFKSDRYPTGIVMQEGYAKMIGELNKSLVQ